MADSDKYSYIRQALADSCLIWQLSDLTAVRSDSCQTWQLSKWKIPGKISSPLHTAKIHEAQQELCFSKKNTILEFKLTNQRTRKATQFNAAIVFSKRYCICEKYAWKYRTTWQQSNRWFACWFLINSEKTIILLFCLVMGKKWV